MLNNYSFIDDGKYEWQDVYTTIKENFECEKNYDNLLYLSGFIYWSIHDKFYKLGTENAEKRVRELVKYVISNLLPFVNNKIDEFESKANKNKNDEEILIELDKWLELEDDLYALASYRSLMHFANYLERQDDYAHSVWKYNMNDSMGGVFYYANAMILNKSYRNMIKQCPTGYGKSKSDCVIICFILGYDVNAEIMKIVGNPSLVVPITQNIVNMLTTKLFAKVFPIFEKYDCSKNLMFSTCKISSGEFALKESTSSLTFACYNKETKIDGGRFNYQFYDDVTQSDDRENVSAHMRDRGKYTSMWKKRCFDEFSCLRFFTGTAYHREDFISFIRKYLANNRPLIPIKTSIKQKWTKFVKQNEDKDTIYVTVPKLADLELGEDNCYCTFPQKYSKKEALKMLHSSVGARREFMAMEQQQPLPPETLAFDWSYLLQYKELPIEIVNKQCYVKAILDPNRKGRDNYACLIFKKPINDNLKNRWHMVDCYYKSKSTKYALPEIIPMLAKHNVDELCFENNTTDDYLMEKEIKTQLLSYGLKNIKVSGFFSTKNKEDKISAYRDDIRENIVFPLQGMYYEDSDMGRAMSDIVNYSIGGKNLHDDSIDCCAMLSETETKDNKNTIETFNLRL